MQGAIVFGRERLSLHDWDAEGNLEKICTQNLCLLPHVESRPPVIKSKKRELIRRDAGSILPVCDEV